MADRSYGDPGADREGGLLKGMALIVVVGMALGLAYNGLGLRNQTWGLSWIAEDRGDLPELELGAAAPAAGDGVPSVPRAVSDDPMAIPAATATSGLPSIPDLGRPIQIQLEAVKRFHDAGAVLIVDAREPEEYAAGHIPGAIHLSAEAAVTDPALLESVDSGGRPIITYCGGGTCELSLNLAWALMGAGHSRVLVFMGGYPAWEEAGYPIETGGSH